MGDIADYMREVEDVADLSGEVDRRPHGCKRSCDLFDQICVELCEFDPVFYSQDGNGVSIYVHFRNLPNGLTHKLRISNHNERQRYGYKWQLRWDGLSNIDRKQYSRYFDNVPDLVKAFKNYYGKVERDTPKDR
jgi:hypothetical protein